MKKVEMKIFKKKKHLKLSQNSLVKIFKQFLHF